MLRQVNLKIPLILLAGVFSALLWLGCGGGANQPLSEDDLHSPNANITEEQPVSSEPRADPRLEYLLRPEVDKALVVEKEGRLIGVIDLLDAEQPAIVSHLTRFYFGGRQAIVESNNSYFLNLGDGSYDEAEVVTVAQGPPTGVHFGCVRPSSRLEGALRDVYAFSLADMQVILTGGWEDAFCPVYGDVIKIEDLRRFRSLAEGDLLWITVDTKQRTRSLQREKEQPVTAIGVDDVPAGRAQNDTEGREYRRVREFTAGQWAAAGDLEYLVPRTAILDSVVFAHQSPHRYLVVKGVAVRNRGRHTLQLSRMTEEGLYRPALVLSDGYQRAFGPRFHEITSCIGLEDLLRKHGVGHDDIVVAGRELVQGGTVSATLVYFVSRERYVAELERGVDFVTEVVKVTPDGNTKSFWPEGKTFIRGARVVR